LITTPSESEAAGAGLTLLTRADCGLCEQMHSALQRLATRVALPALAVVDVDAFPELQRRWGLKIPVLLLDGTVVCRTRLDEPSVLAALQEAARAGRG
jgi:hypothetical protein